MFLVKFSQYLEKLLEKEEEERLRTDDIVRHFKNGNLYLILHTNICWHDDTCPHGRLVLYKSLQTNIIYARPFKMFMSKVNNKKYPDAKQEYRFELYRRFK